MSKKPPPPSDDAPWKDGPIPDDRPDRIWRGPGSDKLRSKDDKIPWGVIVGGKGRKGTIEKS